jgi:hypothetical protein
MKILDYKANDIVVCTKDVNCRGRRHPEGKTALRGHFYLCRGVYTPTIYSPKDGVTCGLEGFTFILTASRFRKATEAEMRMYESGAKSIYQEPLIFN